MYHDIIRWSPLPRLAAALELLQVNNPTSPSYRQKNTNFTQRHGSYSEALPAWDSQAHCQGSFQSKREQECRHPGTLHVSARSALASRDNQLANMMVFSITDLSGLHAIYARVRYEHSLLRFCLPYREQLAAWPGYAQATLTVALQIDARGLYSIAKVRRKEHIRKLGSQSHRGEQHQCSWIKHLGFGEHSADAEASRC